MTTSPSLERELERRAGKSSTAAALNNSYILMKERLRTQYYPWIQANLPYYTDHGERHIDAVIHAASHLLGARLVRNDQELTTLDIFLTLSAIIWHDAGMVLRRSGHQIIVANLMNEVRSLAFPTPQVFRLVVDIVKAHTGSAGLDIPDQDCSCTVTPTDTFQVYPRALAAIVRFSDEVSENQTRISRPILPHVPPQQQIFWHYAASITSSVPDPGRQRVVVAFEFQAEDITRRFLCAEFPERCDSAGTICLLDYALCRIEKINTERTYCARVLGKYADIRDVVIRMSLLRGTEKQAGYENIAFTLGDVGLNNSLYPVIPIVDQFFRRHPDWRTEALEEALRS